ncbi:hypothetical protein KEM54_005790 [Ascosphaera aggregata]|nr:hypothetical protein KEM54_005790 [Ascosphaera aggregata]
MQRKLLINVGHHIAGEDGRFVTSASSLEIDSLYTLKRLFLMAHLDRFASVFNTVFASVILSEPFTGHAVIGTILVCTGAILIASFGAISEPPHDLDQLLVLLKRPQFVIWICATLLVVSVILVSIHLMRLLSAVQSSWLIITRGKRYSLIPYSDLDLSQESLGQARAQGYHCSHRHRMVRGMLYGTISGILSAHTLLLAKSVVELLVRTLLQGANQFRDINSWFLLLSMVTLALIQLYFLHCGLKLCSTSVLYPFVFCVYNVIAILDGLIYFSESAAQLTILDGALIALGTVILLTGVLFLSWRLEGDYLPAGVVEGGESHASDETAPGPPSSSRRASAPSRKERLWSFDGGPLERSPLVRRGRCSISADSYGTCQKPPQVDTCDIWAELEENGRISRNADVLHWRR